MAYTLLYLLPIVHILYKYKTYRIPDLQIKIRQWALTTIVQNIKVN